MLPASSPTANPAPEPTTPATNGVVDEVYTARQRQVSEKLAADLNRLILNYRTHDKKQLTEGEVIVALGLLVGGYVKSQARATTWMQQITMAALDATKGTP